MTRTKIATVAAALPGPTSAKISVGIAIIRSTKRDISSSNQPATTAAVKLRTIPSEKDSVVAARATKIVVRAP